MLRQALHIFVVYSIMFVLALEDFIFISGQSNQEMVEHGRSQYQLLKERSHLPKYGPCWRAAIQNLDEGCRYLSEDTQSDIALHITNCFLEMSGHETYNCELDKKPNLRAICINSMSDRAFNVYTEFYTHTQNMCWFLRGQIWHETIAENTLKVGKQLEMTAEHQEDILKAQKESLAIQEKMILHGRFLEQVLEDLYVSSKTHQDILKVLSQSVRNLQAWIIGEISWLDTVIFYTLAIILIFVITSTVMTISARLPIFMLLLMNIIIERLLCSTLVYINQKSNPNSLYTNVYDFVWYSRYGFVFLAILILIYKVLAYKDPISLNNELLSKLIDQNNSILDILCKLKVHLNSKVNYLNENSRKSIDQSYCLTDTGSERSFSEKCRSLSPDLNRNSYKEDIYNSTRLKMDKTLLLNNIRYNLRSTSRQGTPDSTHV